MAKPMPIAPTLVMVALVAALFTVMTVGADTSPPNFEKALAAQRTLADERPYDATVQNDLGNLLLLTGRPSEAESAYRRALEIDDNESSARFNLALLLQADGRPEEARAALETLVEHDPNHAWGHYQLGVLLADDGDRKAAIDHYARSFALDATLSFPEQNPHIIDNDLSTEALLKSSSYRASESLRVPRQYGEADRIANLMIALEAEEAAEELADEGEAEASPEVDEKAEGYSGALRPGGGGATFDGEDVAVDDGAKRVLTQDDLDTGSSLGQVQGGGSRVRSGRGSTRYRPPSRVDARRRNQGGGGNAGSATPRYRPGAEAGDQGRNVQPRGGAPVYVNPRVNGGGGRIDSGGQTAQPPRAGRPFRPGGRSSAQLQLDLGPRSSEPVAG